MQYPFSLQIDPLEPVGSQLHSRYQNVFFHYQVFIMMFCMINIQVNSPNSKDVHVKQIQCHQQLPFALQVYPSGKLRAIELKNLHNQTKLYLHCMVIKIVFFMSSSFYSLICYVS